MKNKCYKLFKLFKADVANAAVASFSDKCRGSTNADRVDSDESKAEADLFTTLRMEVMKHLMELRLFQLEWLIRVL